MEALPGILYCRWHKDGGVHTPPPKAKRDYAAEEAAKPKKMPGFDLGIRDNTAVRMLKMVRPICPNSKMEMEYRDGRWVPKTNTDPNRQNCQLAGDEWWVACEALGHDPYHQTFTWTTTEPKFEQEPNGDMVKVGERTVLHTDKRANFAQVAITNRMNSGQGAIIAKNKKGFRRLADFNYEEVCQFRNCQKPIDRKARSRRFGDYCSKNHLALIAAAEQEILLTQLGFDLTQGDEQKSARKRQNQLREAIALEGVEA